MATTLQTFLWQALHAPTSWRQAALQVQAQRAAVVVVPKNAAAPATIAA